jgi:hypothetical protein
VNSNDIFIFGGYTEKNVGSTLTYVFTPDEKDDSNCIIKQINWKPLPIPEGFWNNTPIILDN